MHTGRVAQIVQFKILLQFFTNIFFTTNSETRDYRFQLHWKLLNVITMGQRETDHNIQMIKISESIYLKNVDRTLVNWSH